MIGGLINLAVVVPLLVGIITVDVVGEPRSIREFLASDFFGNITGVITMALPTNVPDPKFAMDALQDNIQMGNQSKEFFNVTEIDEPVDERPIYYIIDIDLEETGYAINSLNTAIAEGLIYFVYQIKEFGVWLGMATAPFHYLLAVLIAFSFLSPYNWLWIGSIFWVVTTERKEIYNIFKSGILDAHLKTKFISTVSEITSKIKRKGKKNE